MSTLGYMTFILIEDVYNISKTFSWNHNFRILILQVSLIPIMVALWISSSRIHDYWHFAPDVLGNFSFYKEFISSILFYILFLLIIINYIFFVFFLFSWCNYWSFICNIFSILSFILCSLNCSGSSTKSSK